MALTNKQQAFASEYVKDFNATQAAIRAGYSEKTARAQGQRLLTNVYISKKIKTNLDQRAMTANEVLARLADMARGDITQYITGDGYVDIDAMRSDGAGHLLKKYHKSRRTIYPKGGGEIETEKQSAEFYDAQAALSLIGKHHALFTDRIRVDDWQSDIVTMLQKGEIKPEEVRATWPDLAAEFFSRAGVNVS